MADEKFVDEDQEKIEASLKKKKEQKRRKGLRNEVTHKLRFDVLQRDNHICQYCGANPKNNKGDENDVELVIDHIVPLDKGGTNDLDNLITSCWECNEGKKARLLKRTHLKREYDITDEKKQEVFALTEKSDFEEYKKFWQNNDNEEVRQLMYDMNELIPGQECMKDCSRCSASGLWYFKGCMQILNRYFKHGEINNDPLEVNSLVPVLVKDLSVITTTEKIPIKSTPTNTLKCDTCYISKTCPQYKTGSFCRYNFSADVDFTSPTKGMASVVAMQQERVNRAMFFEKMSGGAMDKNVTGELVLLSNLLKQFANMGAPKASIKIEAEGSGAEGTNVVGQLMAGIFSNKGNGENNAKEKEEQKVRESEEVDYEETNN